MDMLQSSSDDGMITGKLALDVHLSDNENGEFCRFYLNGAKKKTRIKAEVHMSMEYEPPVPKPYQSPVDVQDVQAWIGACVRSPQHASALGRLQMELELENLLRNSVASQVNSRSVPARAPKLQ